VNLIFISPNNCDITSIRGTDCVFSKFNHTKRFRISSKSLLSLTKHVKFAVDSLDYAIEIFF
jgi:hypothetical protein